jgi:hypothetical protein
MIIPLTPIRDAWGGVEPEPTPTPPFVSAVQKPVTVANAQPPTVLGYSPSTTTAFESYKIPEDYTPTAMDVTVYDQNVIRSLLPMTSDKRTDLVTEMLNTFFGQSDASFKNNENDRVEFFRGPHPQYNDTDSVHIIIILLLGYILMDKLMTIWYRSSS